MPEEQDAAPRGDSARRDVVRSACEDQVPTLFAWARLRVPQELRSEIDAEDVLQEVLVRALSRADAAPPPEQLRAWLFGIAKHVMLELLRYHGRRVCGGPPPGSPERQRLQEEVATITTSVSRRLARDEELAAFVEWVRELGSPDGDLVVHVGLEGMSGAEAARILGISAAAAEKRLSRLRQRLATCRLPFLPRI